MKKNGRFESLLENLSHERNDVVDTMIDAVEKGQVARAFIRGIEAGPALLQHDACNALYEMRNGNAIDGSMSAIVSVIEFGTTPIIPVLSTSGAVLVKVFRNFV